jgi:hypothetical protein
VARSSWSSGQRLGGPCVAVEIAHDEAGGGLPDLVAEVAAQLELGRGGQAKAKLLVQLRTRNARRELLLALLALDLEAAVVLLLLAELRLAVRADVVDRQAGVLRLGVHLGIVKRSASVPYKWMMSSGSTPLPVRFAHPLAEPSWMTGWMWTWLNGTRPWKYSPVMTMRATQSVMMSRLVTSTVGG